MVSVHKALTLYLFHEVDFLVDVVVGCEYAYLAPADSNVVEPLVKTLPTSFLLFLEIAKDVTHGTKGGLDACA